MSLTQEEKERLADEIVAVLRSKDPEAKLRDLEEQIAAGNEGEHGMNSVVLAVAQAMADHLRRGG